MANNIKKQEDSVPSLQATMQRCGRPGETPAVLNGLKVERDGEKNVPSVVTTLGLSIAVLPSSHRQVKPTETDQEANAESPA